MEFETCLADGETIRVDAPFQGRGRRISCCRIAEGDIETSLLQSGTVHLYGFLVEIDAF